MRRLGRENENVCLGVDGGYDDVGDHKLVNKVSCPGQMLQIHFNSNSNINCMKTGKESRGCCSLTQPAVTSGEACSACVLLSGRVRMDRPVLVNWGST